MKVGMVMLTALAIGTAMCTAVVTVSESSMNPIFRGPGAPYAGSPPPLLTKTRDSSAVSITTIAPEAPLRPTENVMTTPPSRTVTTSTTFVKPTHITTSFTAPIVTSSITTASMTTTTTTSVVESSIMPTNTPTPSNNTEPKSFINNPQTAALIALAIILPLLAIAAILYAIWRIRKDFAPCSLKCVRANLLRKRKRRGQPDIPLRRLTPVQSDPYFIDLELGSGFGWGRLSGLSVYMTEEEAAYRRGGPRRGDGFERQPVRGGGLGDIDDQDHGIARPQPVAQRVVGRPSRFLEMF